MSYTYNNRTVHYTWLLLKLTYVTALLVVGIDKLKLWWLSDWSQYVSPAILPYLPVTLAQFVLLVGIIEIMAAIFVWVHPRLGGYVSALWLLAIIVNLATMHRFLDIIVRDAIIAVGALALAWLTAAQKVTQ